MRSTNRSGRFLIACCLLILVIAGCGKKGDPVAPQAMRPAPVNDLAVGATAQGVVLKWSITTPRAAIGAFKLLRSETAGEQACPGCPQDHRPYRTVSITDDGLGRQGERGFLYVDAAVRPGYFYSYRVAACDPAGSCSDLSNAAALRYDGP
jgi:hypothetical protein